MSVETAMPTCLACGATLGPQHRDGLQWECPRARCGRCWDLWEVCDG